MPIIEAEGLTKVYSASSGEVQTLDWLDLAVEEGTVRGILGPNGAGKTTTVKIRTTLICPTAGSARVAGIDVPDDGPGPEGAQRPVGRHPRPRHR